jgi:hypothetical protein
MSIFSLPVAVTLLAGFALCVAGIAAVITLESRRVAVAAGGVALLGVLLVIAVGPPIVEAWLR